MRVLLSTFGSRGDVQPVLGLAVALRALGADARVCAPPDEEFAKLFAAAGVPLLPAFTSVREWVAEMLPKRATISLPKLAAQVMAAQYEAISAAAQGFDVGCDVMVATGLFSSVAAAQSVAEKLGTRYVHATYCPIFYGGRTGGEPSGGSASNRGSALLGEQSLGLRDRLGTRRSDADG